MRHGQSLRFRIHQEILQFGVDLKMEIICCFVRESGNAWSQKSEEKLGGRKSGDAS